jgi:hypothetical protein
MPWQPSLEGDVHTMGVDLAFHRRGVPTMEGRIVLRRRLRVWKVIRIGGKHARAVSGRRGLGGGGACFIKERGGRSRYRVVEM